MPAKKLTPQQERDRRAKMMLGALGVVFVAVLGFELPSLMGGHSSTPSATPPATSTTGGSGAAVPASATAPALPVVAAAQPGQLTKFSHFAPKNPFHSLASATPAANAGAGGGAASGAAGSTAGAASSAPGTTSTPAKTASVPSVTFSATTTPATTQSAGPMVLAAVLMLNGRRVVVPVNFPFPEKNPVFKLVAVGRKAMWISLVGGSFGSGQQTLKVVRARPVKLVNQTAQLGYVIRLVRMTMVPKPAPLPTTTTTTTAPPSATTVPTTTTTPAG